jgi:putative transposase
MRLESTFLTPVFSHRQCFAHSLTTSRAILRRVARIHLDHYTASFFRFARKYQDELIPSRVTDALGEMMILHHPFDVQIFHGDRVELAYDLERRLVMKIGALASDLLMLPGQKLNRLASPIAPLVRTARDSALRSLQFAFRLSEKFRVLDCFSCRESGEILNPDINPNRLAGFRKVAALILFNCEDHIPTVGFTFNHAGFDRSLNRTREMDPAGTDLGQVKFVALEAETALRVGEGIEARGGFESRIARLFSILHAAKESAESFLNPAKCVLKDLAINLAHIFTNLLDLRKLEGLSVIVDRKPVDPIGVASLLNRGVVKLAASVERSPASGQEFGIGLQLVFVRLHGLNYTLVRMAKQRLQTLHHCVYSLHFHLVLVTKYRRKAITKEMLERLETIFRETLEKWRSELIEFNGEEDHVHLLFQTNPTVQLSKLVNNLKTVTSRLIRRDYKGHVNRIYRKRVFWHRSYCLISTGGATIEALRKYIEEQGYEE